MKLKRTQVRLVLFMGLSSWASLALAEMQTEGQLFFDSRISLKQETVNDQELPHEYKNHDNTHLSRARLDFSGDITQSWQYHVRLEYDEKENAQIGLDELEASKLQPQFFASSGVLAPLGPIVAQAFIRCQALDGIDVHMGRIPAPEITVERLYYQPYIGQYPTHRPVGAVAHNMGNHPGVSAQGTSQGIGYSVGIWKQTNNRGLLLNNEKVDVVLANREEHAGIFEQNVIENLNNPDELTISVQQFFEKTSRVLTERSFDERNLRLGFAGRLSFTKKMPHGAIGGLGIGYGHAPLNTPIYAITAAQLPTYVNIENLGDGFFVDYNIAASADKALSAYAYGSASYKSLSHFGIDFSCAVETLQFNFGYQQQHLSPNNTMMNTAESNDYGFGTEYIPEEATYNFLGRNSSASSHWLEIAYLIIGDGYHFNADKALVSGVKLRDNQSAFEVVARYGHEKRSNILALLTKEGWSDFNTLTDPQSRESMAVSRAEAELVVVEPTQQALIIKINNTGRSANMDQTIERINTKGVIDFFETEMTGLTLGFNYYMNQNIVFKIEYESRRHEFKRPVLIEYGDEIINDNIWKDSLFNKKQQNLRMRADYRF